MIHEIGPDAAIACFFDLLHLIYVQTPVIQGLARGLTREARRAGRTPFDKRSGDAHLFSYV